MTWRTDVMTEEANPPVCEKHGCKKVLYQNPKTGKKQWKCRECNKETSKQWRIENPDQSKQNYEQWVQKNPKRSAEIKKYGHMQTL